MSGADSSSGESGIPLDSTCGGIPFGGENAFGIGGGADGICAIGIGGPVIGRTSGAIIGTGAGASIAAGGASSGDDICIVPPIDGGIGVGIDTGIGSGDDAPWIASLLSAIVVMSGFRSSGNAIGSVAGEIAGGMLLLAAVPAAGGIDAKRGADGATEGADRGTDDAGGATEGARGASGADPERGAIEGDGFFAGNDGERLTAAGDSLMRFVIGAALGGDALTGGPSCAIVWSNDRNISGDIPCAVAASS